MDNDILNALWSRIDDHEHAVIVCRNKLSEEQKYWEQQIQLHLAEIRELYKEIVKVAAKS